MFRETRRKDRILATEEAAAYLAGQEVGVLSVLGDSEYPYGIPVNYALLGDRIYLHGALEGHKLDAIKRHPKVCFTVFGDTEVLPTELSTNYTSVVVFGSALVVPLAEEKERQQAFEAIAFKYSPKDDHTMQYIEANREKTNVIRIQIEHLSGKRRGPAPK